LDLKYEKAVEMCLNAETILENVNKEKAKADKAREKAYSIFEELGKANHAESLVKQGWCFIYGIAQIGKNTNLTGADLTKSNLAKAGECFKKAVELGHNKAKKNLEDIKETKKLFEELKEAGVI